MATRNRARYLAPLALAVVVVAIVLIISSGGKAGGSGTSTNSATAQTAPVRTRRRGGVPRFYLVKPGDTLSGIAAKTGVSVSSIESLNQSVNPNALQTGQRLRLSR